LEKIAIASDHAGREVKDDIIEFLKGLGYEVIDMGVNSDSSVDYPDYGSPVAEKVSGGKIERAVLLCGTGIGMSILANNPEYRKNLAGTPHFEKWLQGRLARRVRASQSASNCDGARAGYMADEYRRTTAISSSRKEGRC